MTLDAFMIAIKKERLEGRAHWFFFLETVAGVQVEMKCFSHTYLQIFRLDGIDYAGGLAMDSKVGEFNRYIRASLERAAAKLESAS